MFVGDEGYSMNGYIVCVGAGFSGSVIARELAERGMRVLVVDARPHVAGNCFTQRDSETNIMIHVYGPHIFHTNSDKVWNYINQFDEIIPFVNRVKAHARGKVYSLPINLLTINQLFGKQLSPREAEDFIKHKADLSISNPETFEQQALSFVGREIYETFFRGYTRKQWGIEPQKLPASILRRLPVRFNYDDNYYSCKYQGMPKNGYTFIIERILDHPNISVQLSTVFTRDSAKNFEHIFYSGPIDSWFGYSEGHLGYRTLDFERIQEDGDFQGNAVINYCDEDVPWTRIVEHKHFTPWENHEKTIVYREYSRLCGPSDSPYYPIRLVDDKQQLEKYLQMARQEHGVTFVGRLGTYRYLDMDIAISEALGVVDRFVTSL
ncbi:UDP-galactopyranose mutase [Acidithiobacillus sp. AMEEHan]|uniref:UDP-galactopyranose mutase n=1 Tax=Acidithiobacillus sp. AMEEHan TaxID=2994951 RepID=UPI0027E4EECC|nr:UDP-galactopyranose mutase [Acidithiobacillus sp. AMEEHan]